LNNISKLWRP